MAMSRKLGQIIAVRENTWMIRIPLGCDPETNQRNYYNRTVHGSLRQAQKFLGKKINELGANIERDGAKIRLDQYLDQWLKTINRGSAARRMKATRACSQNTSAHH
jgi:hypothetical protein